MTTTPATAFQTAMAMLSHAHFAPILGRLIRARVPDLVEDDGPEQPLKGEPPRAERREIA